MIDRHTQSEAMRRDIATSTDPAWMRAHYGVHQHSKAFIITLWVVGFLAMWGIFTAAASI